MEANVLARHSFSLSRVKYAIRAVDRLQPGAFERRGSLVFLYLILSSETRALGLSC